MYLFRILGTNFNILWGLLHCKMLDQEIWKKNDTDFTFIVSLWKYE